MTRLSGRSEGCISKPNLNTYQNNAISSTLHVPSEHGNNHLSLAPQTTTSTWLRKYFEADEKSTYAQHHSPSHIDITFFFIEGTLGLLLHGYISLLNLINVGHRNSQLFSSSQTSQIICKPPAPEYLSTSPMIPRALTTVVDWIPHIHRPPSSVRCTPSSSLPFMWFFWLQGLQPALS